VGIACQVQQQLVFELAQVEPVAVEARRSPGGFDGQRTDLDGICTRGAVCTAEKRSQARTQLKVEDWSSQEVVGSGVERAQQVELRGMRAEHDHGDARQPHRGGRRGPVLAVAADGLQQVEGSSWQAEFTEDEESWRPCACDGLGVLRGAGMVGCVAVRDQVLDQLPSVVDVCVDHEYGLPDRAVRAASIVSGADPVGTGEAGEGSLMWGSLTDAH
jgi:hypothetical protein